MSDDTRQNRAESEGQEPSMEDILSSIRRILSEESETDLATKSTDHPSQSDAATFGELADEGAGAADQAASELPAEDLMSPAGGGASGDAAAPSTAAELAGVVDLTPDMRVDKVVSKPAAGASADVLAQLAKAILNRRDIAVGGRDVTLESMVREMLRPLLKEWLDRNLPYLIERLVRKEIDAMINRAERLDE